MISRLAKLLLVVVFMFTASTPMATAQQDQRVFNEAEIHLTPWFDHTDDGSIRRDQGFSPGLCSAASQLIGSDHREQAFNLMLSLGLSPPQAAGIVGNLMVESSPLINPTLENPLPDTREEAIAQGIPDSILSEAYGIAQWLGSRRPPMLQWVSDWMKERGVDIPGDSSQIAYAQNDMGADELELYFEAQLNYMVYEVTEGVEAGNQALEAVKNTTSVEEATTRWEELFERSGGQLLAERIDFARQALIDFGSNAASVDSAESSSDSKTCSTSSSGAIVGEFSLPYKKSIFDDNPGLLSRPHHDYPAIDIAVASGVPVYSMSSGTVVSSGPETGSACGQGVIIDMVEGVRFKYCHGLDGGSIPGALTGDSVSAGQLIMHTGSTGTYPEGDERAGQPSSTGPHLHMEIVINGTNKCPQLLLEAIYEGGGLDLESLPSSGCIS